MIQVHRKEHGKKVRRSPLDNYKLNKLAIIVALNPDIQGDKQIKRSQKPLRI